MAESSARGRAKVRYFRTREDCTVYVEQRLVRALKRKQRVLVGWDFSFGYPKGFARALRLAKKQPWCQVWKIIDQLIADSPNNDNNRFAVGGRLNHLARMGSGPFWGVPAGQSGIFLGSKKDFTYPRVRKKIVLNERRLVEQRVPRMQPAWKLAYTGSVGSQTLLGIPRILALTMKHETLREYSEIWPFTTCFAELLPGEEPCVVHAEIYPGMLEMPGKDEIPDREQVRTYVKWLAEKQARGKLPRLLAGPEELTKKERKRIIRHEGWVLGVE